MPKTFYQIIKNKKIRKYKFIMQKMKNTQSKIKAIKIGKQP